MMTRDEAEAAARKGAKVRHENWDDGDWVSFDDRGLISDEDDVFYSGFHNFGTSGAWSIVEPAPTPTPGTVLPLSERGVGTAWHDLVIPGIVKVGDRVRVSWVTQEGDTKHLFHVGDVCEVGLGDTGSGPKYLAVQTRHGGFIAPRGDRVTFEVIAPVEPDLAARMAELEARMTAIENIVIPTPPFEGEALTRLDASLRGAAFLRTSRKPVPGVMGDAEIVTSVMKHFGIANPNGEEEQIARDSIALTRQSVLAQLAANEERAVKAAMDWYDCNGSPTEGYDKAIRAALAAIREGL